MRYRAPLLVLPALLLALLPLLFQIAWPFLTPFLVASTLAIVTHPAQRWLTVRIHRPRLASLLTTLGTICLLGLVLLVAGFALAQELATTYDALNQRSLEEGGWPALVTHTADWILERVAVYLPINKEAIRQEVGARMRTLTGYLLKNVGAAIGGLTSLLITGLLVAIFLYFLLRYGEDWIRWLKAVIPLDPHTTTRLFQRVRDSVIANVNGVLAVMLGQGLLLSLGFWLVGLRSPVLWGAVGGLASLVPIVGSPLVWVPVVIAFLVMGFYGKALILGLWGALLVGSIDNVLRPLVVGAGEKQHPIVMALAAIGGTVAFGALGILLGPLVVSLVIALVQELQGFVSPETATAGPSNEGEQPPVGTRPE